MQYKIPFLIFLTCNITKEAKLFKLSLFFCTVLIRNY